MQIKGSANGLKGFLGLVLVHCTTDSNFTGRYGIDIDLSFCQGLEHLLSNAVMASHPDADYRNLGNVLANENALAIDIVFDLLHSFPGGDLIRNINHKRQVSLLGTDFRLNNVMDNHFGLCHVSENLGSVARYIVNAYKADLCHISLDCRA